MELLMSIGCQDCTNRPAILRYAEGASNLEGEVENWQELVLVKQGVAKCRGFQPNAPGDSLDRRTCEATVEPPIIQPLHQTVITTPERVNAVSSVIVTPPPEIARRVTVNPGM